MPIRVRRLLYHAVVLLAAASFALPMVYYFSSIWIESNLWRFLLARFQAGDWFELSFLVGYQMILLCISCLYLAVYLGLFHFYSWSRYAVTGFAALFYFLYFTIGVNQVGEYLVLRLSMHVILLTALLLCMWTPFVGGEFRRTAKDL